MIEFALVLFAIYTLLPIVITGALILLAIWIAIRLIAIAAGWFLLYLIIVVLLSIFSKCNTKTTAQKDKDDASDTSAVTREDGSEAVKAGKSKDEDDQIASAAMWLASIITIAVVVIFFKKIF